jgi:hypothetical protein
MRVLASWRDRQEGARGIGAGGGGGGGGLIEKVHLALGRRDLDNRISRRCVRAIRDFRYSTWLGREIE